MPAYGKEQARPSDPAGYISGSAQAQRDMLFTSEVYEAGRGLIMHQGIGVQADINGKAVTLYMHASLSTILVQRCSGISACMVRAGS